MKKKITGITPLMRSATNKESIGDLVTILNDPSQRVDVFATDSKGKTALDWARLSKNYPAIQLLLHAVSTDIFNARIEGIAPVQTLENHLISANKAQAKQLQEALRLRNAELAEVILRSNKLRRQEVEACGEIYFTDQGNKVGYTPLMIAAGMNMKDVVRELIMLKCPVNASNKFGHTALTIAAYSGNTDILQFLFAFGADVHHRTLEGRTVLHYTCIYARAKALKVILDSLVENFSTYRIEKHDLVEFDHKRWTTYSSILTKLIETRDNDGKTCLDLLPTTLDSKYRIERRLRLSGVTGLDRLSRKVVDLRSVTSQSGRWANAEETVEDEDQDVVNNDMDRFDREDRDIDGHLTLNNQQIIESNLNLDDEADADHDNDNDHLSIISDVTDEAGFSLPTGWGSNNSDVGFAEHLHDIFSIQSVAPLEQEIAYIRELFQKLRDKIDLWMLNASKEEELSRMILCPLDCGDTLKVEDLTAHVRDVCPYRTLQCSTCHLIIMHKDITEHSLRLCQKRTIACPDAYKGCNVMITPATLKVHLRSQCQARMVPCRQYCVAILPYQEREEHELNHCCNRVIACDQCHEKIPANAYTQHLHEVCSERLIACNVGCGLQFKAKDLLSHEEDVCKGYCKWQCGQKIGPPAILALHEHVECFERPTTCCYDCSVPKLTMRNKARHEQNQCLLRPVPCGNGCGHRMPFHDLSEHLHIFRGSCTNRMVYCPSNLVNWRIYLEVEAVEGLVLKYERRKLAFEDNNAESDSEHRKVMSGDFIYVRSEKGQRWWNIWTTDFVLLEPAMGSNTDKQAHRESHFTCGTMLFTDLDHHLHSACLHRKVAVAGELDRKEGYAQVVSLAEAAETAVLRLHHDDFEHTTHDITASATVNCEYCGKIVDRLVYEAHCLQDCSAYNVYCPFGCGLLLPNRDIHSHCITNCRKRSVTCIDCNYADLWAEELAAHQESKCPKRIVTCRIGCDITSLYYCNQEVHENQECLLRPVQCSCGLIFTAQDIDDHVRMNCINRLLDCPQGCGVKVPQHEMEGHIEHFCRNKTFYFQKTVECSNGCGEFMMRRELLQHVTLTCPKRLIECSLRCGNTMPLDKLKDHLRICPLRILCCEPGMTMCARPLHEWFYKVFEQQITSNSLIDENESMHEKFKNQEKDVKEARKKLKHELQVEHDNQSEASIATPGTIPSVFNGKNYHKKKKDEEELFEGDHVDIKVNANTTGNIFSQLQVTSKHTTTKPQVADRYQTFLDESTVGTAQTSNTSIYYDGIAMKFREQIRMQFCDRHHCHVLIAAIRYDEESLLEYLTSQIKESVDIDEENCYGDTALTLACRLGKLRFVEILIQRGADVNKETNSGRTALIEAVKCEFENVPLLEYLIKEGCIIRYKTFKHGKTALDWARRYALSEANLLKERARLNNEEEYEVTDEKMRVLGRPRTVRILELAAVVQQQSNMLFTRIAVGDNAWVMKIIQEGDFFGSNNEEIAYRGMEDFTNKAEEADRQVANKQDKLKGLSNKVDSLMLAQKQIIADIKTAEINVEKAYEEERALDTVINTEFVNFEATASKLKVVDLEEIAQFQKPSELLLIAMFACGLIFDLLPPSLLSEEQEYTQEMILDPATRKLWLPLILAFFGNAKEAVRRMQTFSRAKIHLDRTQLLLSRVQRILEVLRVAVYANNARSAYGVGGGDQQQQRRTSVDFSLPPTAFNGSLSNDNDQDFVAAISAIRRVGSMNSMTSVLTSDTRQQGGLSSPVMIGSPMSGSRKQMRQAQAQQQQVQQQQNLNNLSDVPYFDAVALEQQRNARVSRLQSFKQSFQEEEEIPDAEWDSDAEGSTTGQWVRGEWQAVSQRKEQWWDRNTRHTETMLLRQQEEEAAKQLQDAKAKIIVLTDELIAAETRKTIIEKGLDMALPSIDLAAERQSLSREKEQRQFSRRRRRKSSLLRSSQSPERSVGSPGSPGSPNSQLQKQLSDDGQSQANSSGRSSPSPSSRKSRRRNHRRSRPSSSSPNSNLKRGRSTRQSLLADELLAFQPMEGFNHEDFVGYSFVEIITSLLKAITRYSLDFGEVRNLKLITLQAVKRLEELKQQKEELKEQYEHDFAYRKGLEDNYIQAKKTARLMTTRRQIYYEKVRVARLLNYVSVNGHTAISWAASYGCYELVEEMLSRGASVGYTAGLYHLTAKYIQLSYKIYRVGYDARMKQKQAADLAKATANYTSLSDRGEGTSKAHQMETIRQLTTLKDMRTKLLINIHYLRSRMRFPIPEAIYCGKWEIMNRINERRLLHVHFMNTWIFPSPPPTYSRAMTLKHHYDHDKLTIHEVLAHGMNDISAGIYDAERGWVGANDASDPFGEAYLEVHRILAQVRDRRNTAMVSRYRVRILANERKNQIDGNKAMVQAIYKRDFALCIQLAERRGISIDLETEDGQTALIAACEEDADAVNHVKMKNIDGRRCLAVEYLLDRKYYRPAINLETTAGYTALIRATMLGRGQVVSALLDRGADINHINAHGRNAVHYAVKLGVTQVTRILIERFADLSLRDCDGLTAYEIAEKENYIQLMALLSQYQSGYVGALQLTRGQVNDQTTCPLGCGAVLYRHERLGHLEVCQLRIVSCPNQCGEHTLMAREVEQHLVTECKHRFIACPACETQVICIGLSEHEREYCNHRLLPCPLRGCGKMYPAFELFRHQLHCIYRVVDCPLMCSEVEGTLRAVDVQSHVEQDCVNRRISCPLKCRSLVVCKFLPQHMQDVCSQRLVPCRVAGCEQRVTMEERERHEVVCDYRLEACPERCGEMIPVRSIQSHLQSACLKRPVPCPLTCGMMVFRGLLPRHVEHECQLRLIPCPLSCYQPDDQYEILQTTAKLMPLHLKYDCSNRTIRCSLCEESGIKVCELSIHQEVTCNARIVQCRSEGCQKRLPYREREQHELASCRFRHISCPQSCGENIIALHSGVHCQRECSMRFIDCTLRCGTKVRAKELDMHLEMECIRRHGDETRAGAVCSSGKMVKKKSVKGDMEQESSGRSQSMINP